MDLYDVGRTAVRLNGYVASKSRSCSSGFGSDWLFPPGAIRALGDRLRGLGKEVEYHELDSPHGHDAFLKEWEQMTEAIGPFISACGWGAVAE